MDNLSLVSPQGSAYNLGSWLRADPGPDFGEKDLLRAVFAESPLSEGGALALESVGVRRMSFPLLLPSGGAGLSLAGLQGALRLAARPNAVLDVQLDGEASAAAIRFDVLAGRVEPDHGVRVWGKGAGRLPAVLKLDVQPLGYLPTVIVLASTASVAFPGLLTFDGGSIIGDVPGLARLIVAPTNIGTTFPAGSWYSDMVAWAVGARSTSPFAALWKAGSVNAGSHGGGATLTGDPFAPGSQANEYIFSPTAQGDGWRILNYAGLTEALEDDYRGRHRVFAYVQLRPSQALPWQLSIDVLGGAFGNLAALSSAMPVATIAPAVASGTPGGFGAQPSPAYTLVDLGELTIPPVSSGAGNSVGNVRLWAKAPTANTGVSSVGLRVAGLYFLPLDGGAGVQPRGFITPSVNFLAELHALFLDSTTGHAHFRVPGNNNRLGYDARMHYTGPMPKVGASTVQLDLLGAQRKVASGATGPLVHAGQAWAAVSLSYRPRFAFLKSV